MSKVNSANGFISFSKAEISKIEGFLKAGKSGSSIARSIGRRKKDTLAEIRKLTNKSVNKAKITNPKGQIGKPIPTAQKPFIERLFKQGKPQYYIEKLINKKYPNISKNAVRKYLKQYKLENPDVINWHNEEMKRLKSTGKWKEHLDAKFYRETTKHYSNFHFKEGSPKLTADIEY